ncbi:MAG: phosphoribosylamine--glycine ligase [Aerococcaceae bacterium]|nr:phosphoribosylamine--glycine ligase [Aerococcaceae bacterium]
MTQSVLIIGSGGREHALAKAFAKSAHVESVYVAPGNAGMELANGTTTPIQCVPIEATDFEALCQFVKEKAVAFTFVGPEIPLSQGIVDAFRSEGLAIVGPTQEAAQLESSKAFAKSMMQKAHVPTASYQTFEPENYDKACAYAAQQGLPVVIKEDGLAAGKGVVIATTEQEVAETLERFLLEQKTAIVIETFLTGEEFSFFAFVNGTHVIPIGFARDYKRAYDHDEGLNTGGMGAFAPLTWGTPELEQEVLAKVVVPLAQQMEKEGVPYTGVLYAGLMQTAQGIQVIEFNARFGDPETQILLPLLEQDLFEIVEAHLAQQPITVSLSQNVSLGVVLAAEGYPQAPVSGMPIVFPADFPLEHVCFSGVKQTQDALVANGGRILMVTAQAATVEACRQKVYGLLDELTISQTFYRRDIGILPKRSEQS